MNRPAAWLGSIREVGTRRRPVVAAVLSVLGLPLVSTASGPDLKAELRRAIAVRDAAIEDLSARITYQERARVNRGGPYRERVQVIDAIWDDAGRVRVDISEEPAFSLGRPSRERILMSTDEEGSRAFIHIQDVPGAEPADAPKHPYPTARIQSGQGEIWWAIHPDQVLQHGEWSPSRALERTLVESIVSERDGPTELIRLDWSMDSQNPPGSSLKGSLWLAPGYGYAAVRGEFHRRPNPTSPYKEIAKTECREFSKVGKLDIWLPARVEREEHTYGDDGGYEHKRTLTATFEDWKVNQPIDESTFHLTFPDGTYVMDEIKGINYLQGEINDDRIRASVVEARALASTESALPPVGAGVEERMDLAVEEMGSWSRSWMWGLILALGVLSILIVAWMYLRRHPSLKGHV